MFIYIFQKFLISGCFIFYELKRITFDIFLPFSKIKFIANEIVKSFREKIYTIKSFAHFVSGIFLLIKNKIRHFKRAQRDFLLTMTSISSNFISNKTDN